MLLYLLQLTHVRAHRDSWCSYIKAIIASLHIFVRLQMGGVPILLLILWWFKLTHVRAHFSLTVWWPRYWSLTVVPALMCYGDTRLWYIKHTDGVSVLSGVYQCYYMVYMHVIYMVYNMVSVWCILWLMYILWLVLCQSMVRLVL